MRIYVTKQDIERGYRRSPLSCPVAKAIARRTGHRVAVHHDYIEYYTPGEGGGWRSRLPAHVESWVRSYDLGDEVSPMRFTLPNRALRIGGL